MPAHSLLYSAILCRFNRRGIFAKERSYSDVAMGGQITRLIVHGSFCLGLGFQSIFPQLRSGVAFGMAGRE